MRFTFMTPKAALIARPLARGSYQDGLLSGVNSWAGSDLKGAAARNGGAYRDSRDSLIERMKAAGLHVERLAVERGRIVVVALTKAERRRAKDVPALDVAKAILARVAKANAVLKAERDARRAERQLAEDLPALVALA